MEFDHLNIKVLYHGEIDIAGVELHVDLLVDQGLALLVVVLSDLRSHLESFEKLIVCFCQCLVPTLEQLVTSLLVGKLLMQMRTVTAGVTLHCTGLTFGRNIWGRIFMETDFYLGIILCHNCDIFL